MNKSALELLESKDFKRMVVTKWTMSITLTALLFILYYGFILLVAYDKKGLGAPLFEGGVTTTGIALGVAVILGAWVLTAIYVVWANRSHDKEVQRLKDQLGKEVMPGERP